MDYLDWVSNFQQKRLEEFGFQGGGSYDNRSNMARSKPPRFYVETISEANEEEDFDEEKGENSASTTLSVGYNAELELRRAKYYWIQIMEQTGSDTGEANEASLHEECSSARSRTNSNEVPTPLLNSSNMRVLRRESSLGPAPLEVRPRAYTDPTDLLWVCRQRGTWLVDQAAGEQDKESTKRVVNNLWPDGGIHYVDSTEMGSGKHKSGSTDSLSSPDEPDRTSKCFSASSDSEGRDMDEDKTSTERPPLTHRISAPCRSPLGRRNSMLQPSGGRRCSVAGPVGGRRMGRRQSEVPALTSLARRRNLSQTPAYQVGLKRRGSRGFTNAEFHCSNIRVKAKHEMLANLVLPSFADPSAPKLRERRITYACHPVAKRTKKDEKRFLATKEILVTEKSYLACLSTLKTIFEDPMRECSILCPKDLDVIFPKELEHIRESHTLFMKELEERIQNWRHYGIVGDIFTKLSSSYHINVLMIYSNYVNNFPKAISIINKFSRASHKFRKFLKDCSMDPGCAGLDLPAYLLTPIQRLPRYVLLLRQVSKYTDSSHPDSFHLKNALETMTQMINVLNDSIQNSHTIVTSTSPRKVSKKRSLRKKASLKELKILKDNGDIISRITPDTKTEVTNLSMDSGYQPTPTSTRTTAESTQESLTSTPSSPTLENSLSVSPPERHHSVLSRVRSGDRTKSRPVSTGDLDQFYESEHLKEFASIVEENDKDQKSATQSKLKMAKESMRRTWQRRSKKWRRSVEEIFTDSKSESASVLSDLSRDFPSPVENRSDTTGVPSIYFPDPVENRSDPTEIKSPGSPTFNMHKSSSNELLDVTATNPNIDGIDSSPAGTPPLLEGTHDMNEFTPSGNLDVESVISVDSELSGVMSSPDVSPCNTLSRRRKQGQCVQRPSSLLLPSQITAETSQILNNELKATNSESNMAASTEDDIWVPRQVPAPRRFTRSSSDGVRQFVMRSRRESTASNDRRISSGSNVSFNESEDSGVSGTSDTSPSNTLRTHTGSNTKSSVGRTVSSPLYLEANDVLSHRQRRSWEQIFVSGMETNACMMKSDDELDEKRKNSKSKKKFKDVVKQLFTMKRRNSATSISDVVPKTPPATSPIRRSFAVGELNEKISTV